MAELTAAQRGNLKKGAFAVPGREAYPIPDREHAAAALQMSHGGRSGKPASAEDHAAVHALVKKKYPQMWEQHMENAHGGKEPGEAKKAVPAGYHRMPDGSLMKNSMMKGTRESGGMMEGGPENETGYMMIRRGLAEGKKAKK